MTPRYKPAIAVVTFYIIAISLRYLTNRIGILSEVDSSFLKTIAQGIGPALGAWIACTLFRIKMEMGLKGNFRSLLLPLSVYWVFPMLLIGGIACATGRSISSLPVVTILVYGLLEEIGWRGFLQQMLRPLPKAAGMMLIAVMWFVWHLNFELSAQNLLFFGVLVLGSWGIGLVADKTRSLLSVAAFHSINNFFAAWELPELFIGLVLFSVWIATVLLFRQSRKASPETEH